MDRLEGVKVALVHRHDFGRLRSQLLNIDTGTKPLALGAHNDHPHRCLLTQ